MPSACVDLLENMAMSGRVIFAIYGYNANFKHLLTICSLDFNEILCSLGDSLLDSFDSC